MFLGVLAILLACGLLLIPLPRYWTNGWRFRLLDLCHIPLFAFLTLWIGWLFGRRWWTTASVLALLAAGTEVIQDQFGRSGNFPDFVRSCLGIVMGLIVVSAAKKPREYMRLAAHGMILLCLAIAPLKESGPILVDAAESYWRFPVLADFSTDRQMACWRPYSANLKRVRDPLDSTQWSAKLELLPSKSYSGAQFFPEMSDWSGMREFCFEIVVLNQPVEMTLTIKDFRRKFEYNERFNVARTFEKGRNIVHIPLEEIQNAAKPDPVDITQIQAINIFASGIQKRTVVFLVRIWLE
ncbi:MAG: hypothetical protein U1D30_23845 [Planctomycetota bacterium]